MTNTPEYSIPGARHTLKISFPLEKGIFFQVSIYTNDGERLDTFAKQIPKHIWLTYAPWIPLVKMYLGKLLGDK